MLRSTIRKAVLAKYCFSLVYDFIPVLRKFFLYSCGSLITRCISILLAPITLSIISPDQYGALALFNGFISIACILCGFGLRQTLSLEYFHYKEDQQMFMIQELVALYLMLSIPLIFIAITFHTAINNHFFAGIISPNLLLTGFILIFFYFFSELIYQFLQYEQRVLQLVTIQISTSWISLLSTLFFLYYVECGIASMIIGQLLGILVVCMLALTKINIRSFFIVPRYQSIKKYLALGLPFIPSMLCAWLLAAGDRWVLARYATLSDVGIYSIADTFGQLFQMAILFPFSNAYLPFLMKKFAINQHDLASVEKWNRHIMWLMLPFLFFIVSVCYFIAKPIILSFLPATYHEAFSYVWLLLIGYILLIGSYFPAALIQFQKKSAFLAFSLCIPALLNILMNIVLVPHYKITGCVLATVFSYGFYFIVLIFYNGRLMQSLTSSC